VVGGLHLQVPSFGRGSWILYDHGSQDQDDDDDDDADDDEAMVDQEFEWNSDDDGGGNIIPPYTFEEHRRFIRVLAFHPYKEIVFFHISSARVMAYHLSSSKLEDLGELLPVTFKDMSILEIIFHTRLVIWESCLKNSSKSKISMYCIGSKLFYEQNP
jgi:hypothetical protein